MEHVVVVMMENHSFDNYFGMLPRRGLSRADGFRFDRAGHPTAMLHTRHPGQILWRDEHQIVAKPEARTPMR